MQALWLGAQVVIRLDGAGKAPPSGSRMSCPDGGIRERQRTRGAESRKMNSVHFVVFFLFLFLFFFSSPSFFFSHGNFSTSNNRNVDCGSPHVTAVRSDDSQLLHRLQAPFLFPPPRQNRSRAEQKLPHGTSAQPAVVGDALFKETHDAAFSSVSMVSTVSGRHRWARQRHLWATVDPHHQWCPLLSFLLSFSMKKRGAWRHFV